MNVIKVLPIEIVYSLHKISLFGLLCTATKDDQCHFCLINIEKDDVLAMNTPCCDHSVHCDCFEMWKITSFNRTGNENTVCAYCRQVFPESELCFLCLQPIHETEIKTICCNTFLHNSCVQDLKQLRQILNENLHYTSADGVVVYGVILLVIFKKLINFTFSNIIFNCYICNIKIVVFVVH